MSRFHPAQQLSKSLDEQIHLSMDPLQVLPPEIALRIVDFTSISDVASLTRVCHSWHSFIDHSHQDAIYASSSKTWRPPGQRSLSFLADSRSFAKYFDATHTWKDLCKRQQLLNRNWNSDQPVTRESIIQIGNDAVWRFRADFERRFIVSTSQQGGLNVTDMDSGRLLWRLLRSQVRPFAHLEYHNGIAVWDNDSDTLQVWKTGLLGLARGEFRNVATLSPGCETRGFQLTNEMLCVVSANGKAFTYDIASEAATVQRSIEIERGAVGHLYQDANTVLICMGKAGYHFYDKKSGKRRGIIKPDTLSTFKHIHHPPRETNSIVSTGNAFGSLPSVEMLPRNPTTDRLTPIELIDGPFQRGLNEDRVELADDEWGAAVLSNDLMIAISKTGRVLVCKDWGACLEDPKELDARSYIIECESDGSNFDLGGWLSVRDDRIMFEVLERVYIVSLGPGGHFPLPNMPGYRPSFAFNSSSAVQLTVPVSFMALEDDCIMSTYTTLGWHRPDPDATDEDEQPQTPNSIFPTKTIRIISLALSLRDDGTESPANAMNSMTEEERHANILSIMDMLSEDDEDYESE